MESENVIQGKKLAAIALMLAFLSAGFASLPVLAASNSATGNIAPYVTNGNTATVNVSPNAIQIGGTVNIAVTVTNSAPITSNVDMKVSVTTPHGETAYAWYIFKPNYFNETTPYSANAAATLVEQFPSSAFVPSLKTDVTGIYYVTLLYYSSTGRSYPVATTDFTVSNGINVVVSTNAATLNTAAHREGSFTINAAATYASNSAPVNTATESVIAYLYPKLGPSTYYTTPLQPTSTAGVFAGVFKVPDNAYSGQYTVVVSVSDGIGNTGEGIAFAYVNTTKLTVTASINGTTFEKTSTAEITANAAGVSGLPLTNKNATFVATLWYVVNSAANAATHIKVPLSYSNKTHEWTADWQVPYSLDTSRTYYFNVTASDDLIQPDTGWGVTGKFTVTPAFIKIKFSVTPQTATRGANFTAVATATWPNGTAFTSMNFGTDAGYMKVFSNGTQALAIKTVNMSYSSSLGEWIASIPTYWNTTSGHYLLWAVASDQGGNGGISSSQTIDLKPATLIITPWSYEVINGNSTKATIYFNFNVTYPSDLVAQVTDKKVYNELVLSLKDILQGGSNWPNGHPIDAYIYVNGQPGPIRNGYNWYANSTYDNLGNFTATGSIVYSLYTPINTAKFSSVESTLTNSNVTDYKVSGAVQGWPISATQPLGDYRLEIAYYGDVAVAPNTGSGSNDFPVAKVLTSKLPLVNQSESEMITVNSTVYTAGTWGKPAVNSKFLPSSFTVTLVSAEPWPNAHNYTVSLTLSNATTGFYTGTLMVDNAPNPGAKKGMYVGLYYANENLTFAGKLLEPYVTDYDAANQTVNGDLVFLLTRPYITSNATPIVYPPNVWYSVNGTVTDNYGHPVPGLTFFYFNKQLGENQSLTTNKMGVIEPTPNTGYVLIIPSDTPNGFYNFTFEIPAMSSNPKTVSNYFQPPYVYGPIPTYKLEVEKTVVVPPLAVSVSVTPSTLQNGTSGVILASVTSNGKPITGATVIASITAPNGTSKLTLQPTSTPGIYSATFSISPTGPAGLYTVSVTATEVGYSTGTGAASFTVTVPVPVVVTKPLSISLSVSPSSIANGTSGVISASITSNGQAITSATVTGSVVTPTGTSIPLLFTTSSSTPGLYTATVSVPSSGPAGTWDATVTASATGYTTATQGIAFTVTMVTPPVIPKPAPPVNLTWVYLLAGLAAIFALIALIYIAIKLK